ncbi:SDR family oxidoreductase [Pseudomonas canadensis]|uniref:SDR family oxidoreductase n=1 Tax=Pseudomonas canadensis TaxID=915099 RepID=UPI001F2F493F|nr:NmrA family NAD(P)-binding protein [Pseudomonas canadensis]MCF5172865.1 NAD(P)H-binding protein [Pseudomonas canadensis]
MSRYIVHGANGAQGAPLLKRLIHSGHNAIAAARNTDSVKGMPCVKVDNTSVASLIVAYKEAKGVFIHLPVAAEAERFIHAQNIAEAIKQTKPDRVIISTSGWVVDNPASPLQNPPSSAIAELIRGVQESGVSFAVVAPRLFFENLLNPLVLDAVKSEGVLRYPIRADYPVSWCSHLDVAEVAEKLFTDTTVTGLVGVGQSPAITGEQLAEGFERYLKRPVAFSSVEPQAFGDMIAPLFGADAAAGVVAAYVAQANASANAITANTSAQLQLALTPRTVDQWLAEISA